MNGNKLVYFEQVHSSNLFENIVAQCEEIQIELTEMRSDTISGQRMAVHLIQIDSLAQLWPWTKVYHLCGDSQVTPVDTFCHILHT